MKKYALIGKKLSYSYSKMIQEYLMNSAGVFSRGSYRLLQVPEFQVPRDVDGINITNPFKTLTALDSMPRTCADAPGSHTVPNHHGNSKKNSLLKQSSIGKTFITESIAAYFEGTAVFLRQDIDACYDEITSTSVNTLSIDTPGAGATAEINTRTDRCAAPGVRLLEYANTDIFGFCISFSDFIRNSSEFAVLGTGATSKMLQILAKHLGKPCKIFGRNSADELAAYTGNRTLLINCTPVGTDGCEHSIFDGINRQTITKFSRVADLVYNPGTTPLIKLAADAGIPAKNGLEMLILQAIAAQAIWNACICITKEKESPKSSTIIPGIYISNPSLGRTRALDEIAAETQKYLQNLVN